MSESCSCEKDKLTFMRVSGISCTCKKKWRYNMVTVGFLIRFEAKPGKEADVERALKGALAAAQEEPETIAYFLIRLGPSTFGVFDAFPDEERRLAHFNARWPQLQERAKTLFVEGSLVMEKVDILGAKLPG
jgi:quinol monooxygenase YgiN